MGNYADFYYYRKMYFLLISVVAGLFLFVLVLWFKVEQQQNTIFHLKQELIDYQSWEEADEIIKGWKHKDPTLVE